MKRFIKLFKNFENVTNQDLARITFFSDGSGFIDDYEKEIKEFTSTKELIGYLKNYK